MCDGCEMFLFVYLLTRRIYLNTSITFFHRVKSCFTISDETCIARILHPIRQEFGKFQNRMQQVMAQNQSTTQ